MDLPFHGKVSLVAGTGAGIGLASAQAYPDVFDMAFLKARHAGKK